MRENSETMKHNIFSLSLEAIRKTFTGCISTMSDIPPTKRVLPYLGEDIIWNILLKVDPKTVGRCKSMSRVWNFRLSTIMFVKENYKENKEQTRSVIIGIRYPTNYQDSLWFIRVFLGSGHQVPFIIPMDNNQYGFCSFIGSEHGIICFRLSMGGLHSRLFIWNPLTRKKRYATDEASKHADHIVSLYAFGFLEDTVEYRILHVHKRQYSQKTLNWSLYTSFENDWTYSGKFDSNVLRIGPKYVTHEEIIYWIGWIGACFLEPYSIITFNLRQKLFQETKVPAKVKSDYHSLSQFNNGVEFISYHNDGFTRQVLVWQLKRKGDHELDWEKMVNVSGFGIPCDPSLFLSKDILSVVECRNSSGCVNDSERTDILSRLKYIEGTRGILLYLYWQEHVNMKTITLHSESLYMV